MVLDFDYAAEHPSDWARAVYPDAAERVAGEWCHTLKHEGGVAVLTALRAMDVGRLPAAREADRPLLVDVGTQVHRMDDPTYRAKGWAIGSGPVEAACKQVVNQRRQPPG